MDQKVHKQELATLLESAVKKCFKTQFQLSVSVDEKKFSPSTKEAQIAGISVKTNDFSGALVLSIPNQTLIQVMNSLLDTQYSDLDADIADGHKEVLNIVFGEFKRLLTEQGKKVEMAIPTEMEDISKMCEHGDIHNFSSDQGGFSLITFYKFEA